MIKIKLSDYPANIGIKFLRESLNQTQEQLAEKTNISKSSIGNYENGRQDFPYTVLLKIAKKYDLEIIIQNKKH